MNKEELEEKYRKAAYKKHHKSGVVEVDLCGEVSPDIGGPQGEVARGAYVQAWVWVPADAVEGGA